MNNKLENKIDHLMSELTTRERHIICSRFGLSCDEKSLQALGDGYKLTRERIRQIESDSLKNLCQSDKMKNVQPLINEIHDFINDHGGIASEEYIKDKLSKGNKTHYAYIKFILTLSSVCNIKKFDEALNNYWYTNEKAIDIIKKSLKNIEKRISKEKLLNEDEIIELINIEVGKFIKGKSIISNKSNLKNIITMSKRLDSNFLNEYGLIDSDEINLRNTRSYIKLILRSNGRPMHYKELAEEIGKIKGGKANIQTCHNELIYYDDFVKVGNGIYTLASALKYKGDIVDVIRQVIETKKNKKIKKQDLIEEIQKERIIKGPTIAKYLYDKELFKKNVDGTYSVV